MGQLVRGIDGLRDAASALGTLPELIEDEAPSAWAARIAAADVPLPFVSGNVSLYNEDQGGSAIPPSPIVSCLGRVPDVARTSTPGFKEAGHALVLVGEAGRGRLGGSLFLERRGRANDPAEARPAFDPVRARAEIALVVALHRVRAVHACHDVSAGGLAQALAEMAFASGPGLGFAAELHAEGAGPAAWFSEEPGFVVEIAEDRAEEALAWADALGARAVRLGTVTAAATWRFRGPGAADDVAVDGAAHKAAWSEALGDAFDVRPEPIS